MKQLLFACVCALLIAGCQTEPLPVMDVDPYLKFDECAVPLPSTFPSPQNDDYLHEERFDGVDGVVIGDHLWSRKMANTFISDINDSLIAIYGDDAELVDWCNIHLILVDFETNERHKWLDIFHYVDADGNQLMNINREVHDLWGYSGGTRTFGIKLIHEATGIDIAFATGHFNPETGKSELVLKFGGL